MGLHALLSHLMVSHNQSTLSLFPTPLTALFYLYVTYFLNRSLFLPFPFSVYIFFSKGNIWCLWEDTYTFGIGGVGCWLLSLKQVHLVLLSRLLTSHQMQNLLLLLGRSI